MTLHERDTLHRTYADYLTWPDGESGELINGVAYIGEPPAPSRLHQELVGALYLQVGLALEGRRCRAYVAPFDVRLPKGGEADDYVDTVVQPDVLIVCNPTKLDERGMRGAPDWIAEVLSASTANHDRIVKLPVYERAGVQEVWLVHPTNRTVTIYRLQGDRYWRPIVLELKGRTAIARGPRCEHRLGSLSVSAIRSRSTLPRVLAPYLVVTGSADMMGAQASHVARVWPLPDLKLIKTNPVTAASRLVQRHRGRFVGASRAGRR